jgi:hypothetical protein
MTAPANDKTLTITVETTRGPQTLTVDKTAKVADVAIMAAKAAGLTTTDRFDLFLKSDLQHALLADRTLVSYHIVDGTVLVLSQIGSGV